MERTSVNSSNIASIGYDGRSQTLEVEFNSGSIYQYFQVPESLYQGLMRASSHGSYFDAYIKKGRFAYRQIR
jgi:hypothetical protein